MDILMWATEGIVIKDRVTHLQHGEEDFSFASPKPVRTSPGEKVYFLDTTGVYGFALYKSYEYRQVPENIEGVHQEGMAICWEGPFTFREPSVRLPRELCPPRRWRYVNDEILCYLNRRRE